MKKTKTSRSYQKLIKAARIAKLRSYSPYSGFRVGAALLTTSGKTYTGCNIENSSFSLTICAERTAIFKAVSESQSEFKAIAIASDARDFVTPCGACRQVISDLAGNIDILLTDGDGSIKLLTTNELLPLPFNNSELRKIK